MLRIIAYDIASPRRLRKVAALCLDYGIRIEKSVFESNLRQDQFDEFWARLGALINREEDAMVCYPICARCEQGILMAGKQRHLEPWEVREF